MTVALQVITGVHVGPAGGFVAGRVARATPVAGQHIDHSTVDATVLSSPISPIDGTWSLTLIRGVVYDVKIDRWAVRTIRVTDDAALDFSYYLETSLELTDAHGGTIPPGSITQYLRGDRTWQTLDKAALGLTHVDDTSDADKPISLAALEALDEKLSRPALTPAGKQLTFDEAGEVVASTFDVGAAGGGLASPDDLALALYGLGMMTVVAGPMITGTDPPQMAPSTAAQVAHLISIGIPEAYIGWNVTGSEAAGSAGVFTLPSVTLAPIIVAPSLAGAQSGVFALPGITLTPAVSAPTLSGLQGGGFSLPTVTLQPSVAAPTLSGVQAGSFALPAITLTPAVSAPTLFGVQAGVGVFAVPAVTLQPLVAAPTLAGVQTGAFPAPSVSLQPQVVAPSLTGLQAGSFTVPAVSLQPVVAAPALVASIASTSGAFTLPPVSLRPVVAAPSLTGVSAASGPTTHTFETLTDSSGVTWTTYQDPDIGDGWAGTIQTGVAGGFTGNCMKIKPAVYYDSAVDSYSVRDTHIMRSGLTIHAGTITFKAKLAQTASINSVYIEVNGTRTSFTTVVDYQWREFSLVVPSDIANATIKLGALINSFQPAVLIDELYIP